MIRVGVVGCGYWGANLFRNFVEAGRYEVRAACDVDEERLADVAARFPWMRTTTNYRELVAASDIDAVAIATPVAAHFEIALAALRAGRHVLLAKPATRTSEQCMRLIDEAERRRLVLLVDHTFIYTPAVRKIAELVSDGTLGTLYYYDSVRINLGTFRHDVDVIWDLAVHDLYILQHLIPARPLGISATGVSHFDGRPENIAYITLFFPEKLIAHVHVNWLAPVKVRRTLVGGNRRMIVYDDVEPSEKVKVYDRGLDLEDGPEAEYRLRVNYRAGDVWAPRLENAEALLNEVHHFAACIETGQRPLTGGEAGLEVVRLLESATESMASQGRLVAAA